MDYTTRVTLSNKHHVTSALYHLHRVMPSVKGQHGVIRVDDLNEIRDKLKLWEKDLYLQSQNESK